MAGFYNIQQAAAKLKKSEDEVRKLVRDGQLREFRDAKGPAYKSDEVDAMAAHMDDTEIGLMDSKVGAPAVEPAPKPAPAKPAPPKPAAPAAGKSDSSVFSLESGAAESDAGKTDVFSLEPAGESGEEKKGGSGSGSSISLLDDLENITIPADPMAETVVSSGEGIEAAAGGSGLMDLARESDDTSLGAELYDEPAEAEAAPAAADSGATPAPAAEAVAAAPAEYYVAPARTYEVVDPMAPAFIAMSAVGLVAILVTGMAVAAAAMGTWPSVLNLLYSNVLFYVGGVVLAAGLAFGIAFLVNRQGETRRRAVARVGAGAEAEAEMPAEG